MGSNTVNLDLHYSPSKWGAEYHASKCNELLGAGAAGPGKSMVLMYDPFEQIVLEHQRCLDVNHPHHIRWGQSKGWALHLRRTFPMLSQTLVRAQRAFPQIDPGAKYNNDTSTWIFSSGYRYQFGHCKDEDDYINYMSQEYTHIAFDELIQFTEEQYEQIKGRLRSSDPVLRGMLKVRAMSNPLVSRGDQRFKVRDRNWVRKRFVEPAPAGRVLLKKLIRLKSGEVVQRTRMYLPATLYDNPDPDFVRQYEEQLQDSLPHIRAAMLYGDWFVTADSYYAEVWNPQLHVTRPFTIPKDWEWSRSMDWGFKAPGTVLWFARDPDYGTLYAAHELTFQKKTAAQVAELIREKELALGLWKGRKSSIIGPADNQLWEERGEGGKSKAQIMVEMGVAWVKADKKSRQHNAERLIAKLADHDNGTRTPGIVFFENCTKCISTIPSIPTAEDDIEVPADGGPDHWHDAVLYEVAYMSHRDKVRGEDDDGERRREKRRAGGGSYGYGYDR